MQGASTVAAGRDAVLGGGSRRVTAERCGYRGASRLPRDATSAGGVGAISGAPHLQMTDAWGIGRLSRCVREWRAPSPHPRGRWRWAPRVRRTARAGHRAARRASGSEVPGPARLVLEGRRRARASTARFPSTSPGSTLRSRRRDRLIVSPGRCPVPSRRGWGWAAQLYATRSSHLLGHRRPRRLESARPLGRRLGARARYDQSALPRRCRFRTQQSDPYYPSSRRFVNRSISGSRTCRGRDARRRAPALAALGRALGPSRDRPRAGIRPQDGGARAAVGEGHGGRRGLRALDSRMRYKPRTSRSFACWPSATAAGWAYVAIRAPPARLAGRRAIRGAHAARVRFHQWLQWLLERQFEAARRDRIMQDWIRRDPDGGRRLGREDALATALGRRPGRSLRARARTGGLPPFVPHRLRSLATNRSSRRSRLAPPRGGLRIDHV